MQLSDEKAFYVADVARHKGQKLFGALLRLVCIRIGIRQSKLTADSKAYVSFLVKKGLILPNEKVDVSSSSLSKACKGSIIPSFAQIRVWFDVIDMIYNSDKTKETADYLGVDRPCFDKDLRIDMYRLAQRGTLEELVDAYQRNLHLIKDLPVKYRNGLVLPTQDTDPNMMAIPSLQSANDYFIEPWLEQYVSEAPLTFFR